MTESIYDIIVRMKNEGKTTKEISEATGVPYRDVKFAFLGLDYGMVQKDFNRVKARENLTVDYGELEKRVLGSE